MSDQGMKCVGKELRLRTLLLETLEKVDYSSPVIREWVRLAKTDSGAENFSPGIL